ncbi:MAG: zinc-dependent alcohol dehydrogenase [Bacillota bacterium]
MKALKAFGPQDLRIVEVPDPEVEDKEVLIKIKSSGICGSDKWIWEVESAIDSIAGHEVAGEVIETGNKVKHLKIGDRVAVNNVVGCGVCKRCRSGEFVRCNNRSGDDVNGGFAELVTAPEINCMLLDKEIDYDTGALIFDNWGTPYAALNRAEVSEKDDVVIFGCGPIGLCAVALAQERGAYVIAVDPESYRRKAAIKAGATKTIDPREQNVPEIVKELTDNKGTDVVIDCSGNGKAYEDGLASLEVEGTFVSVGEEASYQLKPSERLIRNNLNILGSWYTTMKQGKEVKQLIKEERIDPTDFVTDRVTLNQVPDIFEDIYNCKEGILKVLINFE